MRITLLSLAVLTFTTTSAVAQTTYVGPWQPRPTIGFGVGGFAAMTYNGTGRLIGSGTLEIPFTDSARFRVEASRTTLPILPEGTKPGTTPTDIARISRLTVSMAGLVHPGAAVSPYGGFGIGVHRATYDVGGPSRSKLEGYAHAGAEMMVSERLTLDFELGMHGFRDDRWYQRNLITAEAVLRIKMAL